MSEEKINLSSRFPGFYRLDLKTRLKALEQHNILNKEDIDLLLNRHGGLELDTADNMIENMIGVFELPLGLALNFVINKKPYIVPMAIEEPSVIAAVSHSAKLISQAGGFETDSDDSLMIGQIQVVGCKDFKAAKSKILEYKQDIINRANALQPNMKKRGGGAKDLRVRLLDDGPYQQMLIVHLLVDCCDAMGANLINSMVEGLAPLVEQITEGKVFLRILSNLADKRLSRARCKIPFELLAWQNYRGKAVAEGIVLASQFAEMDPYRAATHNKGIMNGIGALCVATGNDWRALEAGAHAFCASTGQYKPLARWSISEDRQHLLGNIEIPIQAGITGGGPAQLHPTVRLVHKILNISSVKELAQVMAAVGLAQNMAAIKALSTVGIQKGHMALHARGLAAKAGAEPDEIEAVVSALIKYGDIKIQHAYTILKRLRSQK